MVKMSLWPQDDMIRVLSTVFIHSLTKLPVNLFWAPLNAFHKFTCEANTKNGEEMYQFMKIRGENRGTFILRFSR